MVRSIAAEVFCEVLDLVCGVVLVEAVFCFLLRPCGRAMASASGLDDKP